MTDFAGPIQLRRDTTDAWRALGDYSASLAPGEIGLGAFGPAYPDEGYNMARVGPPATSAFAVDAIDYVGFSVASVKARDGAEFRGYAGSVVAGTARGGNATVFATRGSIAAGNAFDVMGLYGAIIHAYDGSFAGGRVRAEAATGRIAAGGYVGGNYPVGALAFGYAADGQIKAQGYGAVAMGYARAGNIEATGYGSFAIGYANPDGGVFASGPGSFAVGKGTVAGGDVIASAENSFQFGPGENDAALSLRLGDALHFHGLGAPAVKANGDIWIDAGVVTIHSDGIDHTFTA